MDKEFNKRPTATEIIDIITRWLYEIDQEDDNEIKNQFLEDDKIKPEPNKQIHSHEVYTSKIYHTQKFSEYISKSISVVENFESSITTIVESKSVGK
ncbi:hypothetical protein C2G38_2235119 [Gigaspora rosea]|uniref:Uncharacterized protein n=1 Tax=Gigaspora rosea TaxID=44941 RepID=A0A397TS10_9GLOM|nr:hypothetical protein C2G38_2235119 [Gigaspora rosea]